MSKRFADIGSRVKEGQLLAEIDTPEIDQQLLQARADLVTAKANDTLAQTTAERYQDLIKSESVSRQDLDNADGGYEAQEGRGPVGARQRQAARAAAGVQDHLRAVRRRHHGAQHRHRRADRIGQRRAGAVPHRRDRSAARVRQRAGDLLAGGARRAWRRASSSASFRAGTFKGRIARTAEAIDAASRTLLVEMDLDNKTGELMPGSYAEVALQLPTGAATFRLPVNALIFRAEGLQVAIVQNGTVVMRPDHAGPRFRHHGRGR